MPLSLNIFLVIVLFCCSSFMALSEAAIISLSRHKIRKIIVLRRQLRELFEKWVSHPQEYLIIILTGDTLVTMFLGISATYLAVRILHSEFLIWLIITAAVLIFCELMPKIFGRSNPERISITIIKIFGFAEIILKPLLYPVLLIVDLFSGGKTPLPASRLTSLSVEDLRLAVSEAARKGGIESDTTRMLEGVLKLSRMKARDVMIPVSKASIVDISAGRGTLIERLLQAGHNRVPVYSGSANRITGVVLIKELMDSRKNGVLHFSEDIVRPIITVLPDYSASALMREFQTGVTHCAAVVDKKGILKGIVTLDEILGEIMGEILQEYEHRRFI